jgi:hypothetical protein
MLKGKGLLTPIQRAFLRVFAELPDQEQFYLAGGTALAEFYLGHRLSFDLDLFTAESDLILPFSYQVEAACPPSGLQVEVTRRFATFVEFLVLQGDERLRVDLGLDTPVRFEPPVLSVYGVLVNGYLDLCVDKLLAYFGRAEPRDAADLFFILQEEPLDSLLSLATQKDAGFDLYWLAVALNQAADFPDELERWPVQMLAGFEPVALKRMFQQLTVELMSRVTGAGGGPSPE